MTNEKEIKKFQPESNTFAFEKGKETRGESSTTTIQRKQQETQIVKKFDSLLNLVPTDEQLTGDEKIKNYYSEIKENLKRRIEEEDKKEEIYNKYLEEERVKVKKEKHLFWDVLYMDCREIEKKLGLNEKSD